MPYWITLCERDTLLLISRVMCNPQNPQDFSLLGSKSCSLNSPVTEAT